MMSADQDIPLLTKSQADCLMVLRNPGFSVGRIAVAAKLDLRNAEAALRKLKELGLAEQGDSRFWLVTTQGETCSFQTARDRGERRGRPPKPGAQLVLDLLDRPMGALPWSSQDPALSVCSICWTGQCAAARSREN